jgi:hypothetical protein
LGRVAEEGVEYSRPKRNRQPANRRRAGVAMCGGNPEKLHIFAAQQIEQRQTVIHVRVWNPVGVVAIEDNLHRGDPRLCDMVVLIGVP